jgi:uroporphyrinogen III methyltransferase/synthase
MVLQPPLFGCTVLITRAAKPNDPLTTKLRSLGATILHQPTIEINPPMNYHDFDQAIANMNCFQWLIFTSSHAVEHFFKRLNELKLDARSIGSTKIACVGPGTAESLTAFHVHCDWIPKTYNAACLAETLPVDSSSKILWLRGSRTQDAMRDVFKQRGLELQEVIVYRSSDVQSLLPDVEASLARKPFDWMTITSPAIARSTATLLGNSFSKIPAAVLSHQVADEVIRLGGSVGAIASQATFDSLAEAIVRQEHERSKR